MQYTISEFSKITGISIFTLRYYEKQGLLKPLRSSQNYRVYSAKDVAWVEFIKRLKDTGMPLKQIKQYASLRAQGDQTLLQRSHLLSEHKKELANRIDHLQENFKKLDEKILFYQKEIERKK